MLMRFFARPRLAMISLKVVSGRPMRQRMGDRMHWDAPAHAFISTQHSCQKSTFFLKPRFRLRIAGDKFFSQSIGPFSSRYERKFLFSRRFYLQKKRRLANTRLPQWGFAESLNQFFRNDGKQSQQRQGKGNLK